MTIAIVDATGGLTTTSGLADLVISGTYPRLRPVTDLPDGFSTAWRCELEDDPSEFEVFRGAWNAGSNTITRDTVSTSTSGVGVKHNFSAGTKIVSLQLDAAQILNFSEKSENLGDLEDAAAARGNLGLEIGSDVQAWSAILDATTASYTSAEASKLAGIEASATADQTGAEIKAAYEAEANTNAFTDAEKTKLAGVEAGATTDQTGAEIKSLYEGEANTNAFTDAEKAKLAALESSRFLGTYTSLVALESAHPDPEPGSYGHVDAGIGNEVAVYIWDDDDESYHEQAGASSAETAASIKTKYESNADTNAFTDSEKTKLAGVESGATADQTGAEIKAAYEGEPDTNAFTDAEKTKLAGIDPGANDYTHPDHTGDVTSTGDGATTIAAGAVDNTKLADMATARLKGRTTAGTGDPEDLTAVQARALLNVEDGAAADQTGAEIKAAYEGEADTNAFTDAEQAKLGHISVTQAVDLDQMETDIAALANGMVYQGDWDASSGAFPGGGAAQTGWLYHINIGGTVDGVEFSPGDNIVATTDNASTTTYTGNWSKHDQTDAVQAVAGETGSISASALRAAINVEDGATADQSNSEIEAAYNAQVSIISQAEAEAGTSTTVRRWTAQRVSQAITALARDITAVVDDSAAAVNAFDLDTSTELTHASSNLWRLGNAGTTRARYDKDGHFYGTDMSFLPVGSGFILFSYAPIFNADAGWVGNRLVAGADSGDSTAYLYPSVGTGGLTFTIGLRDMTADLAPAPLILGGNNAKQAGTGGSQHSGGATSIRSGDGNAAATGATDAASGDITIQPGDSYAAGDTGDIIFNRGTANGSGAKGNIMMADLPTASAGLPTGALWNDSGILKVA